MLQNFPTYRLLNAFKSRDGLGRGITMQNLGDLTGMVFQSLFVFGSHGCCSRWNVAQFSLPQSIFATLRCSRELGFGTNAGVVSAVKENSHINERCPGVHIGFGQHNQTDKLTGYFCDIHIDLISQGGLIWVDNDKTPIDLEQLVPSYNPHPLQYNEEDVCSPDQFLDDCCGVLNSTAISINKINL
jgi:hypothetical protein